jgi:glutathione S-transferase
MKLYFAPGACSLAPHILLNEIGVKHTIEKVDLGTKKTEAGADFANINTKGYVPTMDIGGGQVLTEVSTILQYLSDKNEGSNLLPKLGTMERYRAMETLNFIASELHKGLGALFNKALPEEARKMTIERAGKRLGWLDDQLAKKSHVLGDAYSAADAYAFTILNWGQWVGVDMKQWKNISAYMARVSARPAVQAALKAEGLAA